MRKTLSTWVQVALLLAAVWLLRVYLSLPRRDKNVVGPTAIGRNGHYWYTVTPMPRKGYTNYS